MADPIDTSTLGRIAIDPKVGIMWGSPAECAADLRMIAEQADLNGRVPIDAAKLKAIARLMDNWPHRPIDSCVSNF